MKFKILFLVCFIAPNLFSQPANKQPDFSKIQIEVKSAASKFYLPKLLERYKNMDTSLNFEEIQYLYYGYRMINNYNPLSYQAKLDRIKYVNSSKVSDEQVLKICDAELEKDIFDMDFFTAKSVSLYELKHDKALSDKYFNFYYNFCKAIHKTGTGLSIDSPIYIINMNHVDFLAQLIGYKTNGYNKIKNNILIVGLEKNSFGTTDLFFDITLTKEFMPTVDNNSFAYENNAIAYKTDVKKPDNTYLESSTDNNVSATNLKEQDRELANQKTEGDNHLKRKEEILAERKRIMDERVLAKQKLMEERALAREQLIENKKLIRERMIQQREEARRQKE